MKVCFLILFLCVLLSSKKVEAGVSNSSEIRAVFFHRICGSVSDYDWNAIMQTLKGYKFNLCLLPMSTEDYQTSWWNTQKSCTAEAITACHNNGMEAHILFGFLGSYTYSPQYDAIDSQLNVWTDTDGNPWYDPCKNITREKIKNATTELARDLNIDGFNFDYIRYAQNADISYSDECKAKLAQWLADQGKPPITDWPGPFAPGGLRYQEFMEWRVIPVTELVRDVREWMLAYKPNLEFSASVYPLPTWYGTPPDFYRYYIGQDTSDWVAKGYLDFVSPMQYDDTLQVFKDETDMAVNYFVGGPEGKIPLVPFLCSDGECIKAIIPTDVFRDQVNYTRYKSDGIMIWRYGGPGAGSEAKVDIRPYLNKVNETNPNGWFDTFSLQNIRVEDITGTSATIKWDTNLPTTSKVEYNTTPLFVAIKRTGTDMEYWDIDHVPGYTQQDSTNVTTHSITLTGLQRDMTYYYRVQSQDNFGKATSKVFSFIAGGGPITTTTIPVSQVAVSGQLRNATGNIEANIIIYNQGTSQVNASNTTSNGNYFLSVWPGVYDLQYNILYIPNLFIKLVSLNILSNMQNVVNYVNKLANGIYFTVNITGDQEIQVYSDSMPSRILKNGTVLTNVSSYSQLTSNTWFYNSFDNKLYMNVSPPVTTTTSSTTTTSTSTTTTPLGTEKTFGKTNIGGTTDVGRNGGYAHASKFTLSEAGTVTGITAYVKGAWGTVNLKAVIYDGTPSTLIAQSAAKAVTTTASWVIFPISTNLAAGNYYLGIYGASTQDFTWYYDAGSTNQFKASGWSDPNPPNPFGTPSETLAREYSIYANYTTS